MGTILPCGLRGSTAQFEVAECNPVAEHVEQLSLAYNNGIDGMWILNVGDLKPMEYPIQLFMDMAWKPSSVNVDVVGSHTEAFCIETFGKDQGPEGCPPAESD